MGSGAVTWNPADRKAYLKGFKERKQARKAAAQAQIQEAERASKLEAKKEQRNEMKAWLKEYKKAKYVVTKHEGSTEYIDRLSHSKKMKRKLRKEAVAKYKQAGGRREAEPKAEEDAATENISAEEEEEEAVASAFTGAFYGAPKASVKVQVREFEPQSLYDVLRPR